MLVLPLHLQLLVMVVTAALGSAAGALGLPGAGFFRLGCGHPGSLLSFLLSNALSTGQALPPPSYNCAQGCPGDAEPVCGQVRGGRRAVAR
jgi:hypothetical protein